MKRLLDILLAALGLALLWPLLAVLALAVWSSVGRPVLFRQARPGLHSQPFEIVKFRTMTDERDAEGALLPEAERLTRMGRFLRSTSLDELPELWNVLKGEMSLVGPRPCLPNQDELIAERQRRGVFEVRPGITGLAQVNGIDMSDPARLAEVDERMIRTLTLTDYFRYLLLTATGKGAGDRVRSG